MGSRISLQPEGQQRMGIIHLSFQCLRKLSQLLETAQGNGHLKTQVYEEILLRGGFPQKIGGRW